MIKLQPNLIVEESILNRNIMALFVMNYLVTTWVNINYTKIFTTLKQTLNSFREHCVKKQRVHFHRHGQPMKRSGKL